MLDDVKGEIYKLIAIGGIPCLFFTINFVTCYLFDIDLIFALYACLFGTLLGIIILLLNMVIKILKH